ncbi:MBL fold metallo-hydrolase [Methanolobus halotolerans]|uniref:Hydrolase n=1 Tax=Methanolobus halotolerans TaxID=2052935 RepID=A0A4E0PUC1_9EURY|nr:MBL fold metallo-hydrolase [Methanolobus halotolerans]TGC06754.1 hydrolase [Methanolobus halotolerans]
MGNVTIDNVLIDWLGHAGFMIKADGLVIHIDPYMLQDTVSRDDMADILLLTHEHGSHCHPDSIRRVRKSDATTLVPENMGLQFRGDARRVEEGDSLTGELAIKGVGIEVVPAYTRDSSFHPREDGVGYIIEVGGLRIYHSGDTDFIPEMSDFSADVALLPIGGTSTMDEVQAAEATAIISPKIVIPMHYSAEDTLADPEKFRELVKQKAPGTDVVIL